MDHKERRRWIECLEDVVDDEEEEEEGEELDGRSATKLNLDRSTSTPPGLINVSGVRTKCVGATCPRSSCTATAELVSKLASANTPSGRSFILRRY